MNDNKRIAVNTGVIYIKLILSALIGLYTSRVVLQALGADDYGLYSVVGGIVTFMNVIGTTMVSVSNRYIAVELGKGEAGDSNKVFNTVLAIHIVLAIGLLLVGETIGVFYVNHYLNVAAGKISDALFVLHISLLTSALTVFAVPYNGLIVAREKFIFTSAVSLSTLLLKLLLVILLASSDGNRLRVFALIMALITIITQLSNIIYCRIYDKSIIKWSVNRCKSDYRGVFNFAWWSLFGAVAYIGKEQGAAMIINFFFGTVLNAAFGLATQINNYAMMFAKGLGQAAVPQIMKSYGGGNSERSLSLVYNISRITTLIMLIIVIPLSFCMQDILVVWLKTPPEYTDIFAVFMLINACVAMLGSGFDALIQSTGKIKKNEIYSSVIYLSLLPIICVLYKLGLPPYINVIVLPILTFSLRAMQCVLLRKMTDFNFNSYCRCTLLPVAATTIISCIPLFVLRTILNNSVVQTLFFILISVLWISVVSFFFGFRKDERQRLVAFVNNRIRHI